MPTPEDRNRSQGQTWQAPSADVPGEAPAAPDPQTPPLSDLSTTGSSTAPVPTTGFGERRPALSTQHSAALPWTYDEVSHGATVPVTVKVACFLTWVFSGLVALLYIGMLTALLLAEDRIVDYVLDAPEWQRANLDSDLLVPVLWVGCLMFLAWSLGACVLAWFAWRRHNWARWVLVVSAGVTVVAAMFAFPVGVLHQLAAALTVAGLLSAAARAWYASQPWGPGGPSGSQPASQQAPPPAWQSAPPPTPDRYPPLPPQPGQGQQPPQPDDKPPVW